MQHDLMIFQRNVCVWKAELRDTNAINQIVSSKVWYSNIMNVRPLLFCMIYYKVTIKIDGHKIPRFLTNPPGP